MFLSILLASHSSSPFLPHGTIVEKGNPETLLFLAGICAKIAVVKTDSVIGTGGKDKGLFF